MTSVLLFFTGIHCLVLFDMETSKIGGSEDKFVKGKYWQEFDIFNVDSWIKDSLIHSLYIFFPMV